MVRRRTNLEHFVAESSGHAVWVGVDVHKRTYAVALLREDGELAAYTTTSDNETLLRQLREWKLAVLCLAYESGPTGFGLARCCGRAGIPVIVAAPSRILRPVSPAAKTDSLDCRKLAELASRRMLRRIAVPTEEEEALRALERRRHQLADGQRKARQRIKSFLLFHGIPEPAGLESWTSASEGPQPPPRATRHPRLTPRGTALRARQASCPHKQARGVHHRTPQSAACLPEKRPRRGGCDGLLLPVGTFSP